MTNGRRPTAFLAYASDVPALQETVENAAKRLNDSNAVEILSWTKLQIGGRILISNICTEIDQRDIFIADITQLNPNVLFELGYAIARNRRIWLMLDGGVERAHPEVKGFTFLNKAEPRGSDNAQQGAGLVPSRSSVLIRLGSYRRDIWGLSTPGLSLSLRF